MHRKKIVKIVSQYIRQAYSRSPCIYFNTSVTPYYIEMGALQISWTVFTEEENQIDSIS